MQRSLSRETIKYLAALAMLLDHIAVIFLREGSMWYTAFRMAGGMTAVSMCYFLAEGFEKSSNRRNYRLRMLVFALLAQAPYQLAFSQARTSISFAPLNMLFNLFLCLCLLEVMASPTEKARMPVLVLVPLLCCVCDWSFLAPAYVMIFHRLLRTRSDALSPGSQSTGSPSVGSSAPGSPSVGNRPVGNLFASTPSAASRAGHRAGIIAWGKVIGLNVLFSVLVLFDHFGPETLWWCAFLSVAGQICAFALIEFGYNGKCRASGGRMKYFHKWFFYLWYPVHLLMLWVYAIVC